MIKNAKKYAERLDMIANEIEPISKELAYQIDCVSDVLEGLKEASSLQFDPDEARYMAGRFNYNVVEREADEPYMDHYNSSDFEQVMRAYRNPTPVKISSQIIYKKVK